MFLAVAASYLLVSLIEWLIGWARRQKFKRAKGPALDALAAQVGVKRQPTGIPLLIDQIRLLNQQRREDVQLRTQVINVMKARPGSYSTLLGALNMTAEEHVPTGVQIVMKDEQTDHLEHGVVEIVVRHR